MYYYLNWLSSQLLFLPKFYKNLLYIGWVSKNLMCKCANSLEMPILVRVFFFFENYTLFDSCSVTNVKNTSY